MPPRSALGGGRTGREPQLGIGTGAARELVELAQLAHRLLELGGLQRCHAPAVASPKGPGLQLGLLPRMTVRHTSATEAGQIFVPQINTALAIAVLVFAVLLVLMLASLRFTNLAGEAKA